MPVNGNVVYEHGDGLRDVYRDAYAGGQGDELRDGIRDGHGNSHGDGGWGQGSVWLLGEH